MSYYKIHKMKDNGLKKLAIEIAFLFSGYPSREPSDAYIKECQTPIDFILDIDEETKGGSTPVSPAVLDKLDKIQFDVKEIASIYQQQSQAPEGLPMQKYFLDCTDRAANVLIILGYVKFYISKLPNKSYISTTQMKRKYYPRKAGFVMRMINKIRARIIVKRMQKNNGV